MRRTTRCLRVGMLAAAALLAESGCVRLATAPLRAQQEQKAEAAFRRLAALRPGAIAQFFDDRLDLALQLTPGERLRVHAIDLRYAGLLHDAAASPDSVRDKLARVRDLEADKDSDLRGVLTTAQYERYQGLKDQLRAALRAWATGQPP